MGRRVIGLKLVLVLSGFLKKECAVKCQPCGAVAVGPQVQGGSRDVVLEVQSPRV